MLWKRSRAPLKLRQSELEFFMKEHDEEAQQVHRRADHYDPAGAGSWVEDGGRGSQAWCEQCDVLQMAGGLWRHQRIASAKAESARGQERATGEAAD